MQKIEDEQFKWGRYIIFYKIQGLFQEKDQKELRVRGLGDFYEKVVVGYVMLVVFLNLQ